MYSFKDITLILGSSSPRRHELISYIDCNVETLSPPFDESTITDPDPQRLVCLLAQGKASSILQLHDLDGLAKKILITSDTVVYHEGKILGKPTDKEDAVAMLKSMSGKTHQVYTCVNFSYLHKNESLEHRKIVVTSDVSFAELSDEEIESYTSTTEPYDKAGSYAVQGRGCFMIKEIKGSHTNVMGLPLAETIAELKKILPLI